MTTPSPSSSPPSSVFSFLAHSVQDEINDNERDGFDQGTINFFVFFYFYIILHFLQYFTFLLYLEYLF